MDKFSYEISFLLMVLLASLVGLKILEDEKKMFKTLFNCFSFGLFVFFLGIASVSIVGGSINCGSIYNSIIWKEMPHGRLSAFLSMGFIIMCASMVLFLKYSVKLLLTARKSC